MAASLRTSWSNWGERPPFGASIIPAIDQLQTVPAGGLPASTPTSPVTSPDGGGTVVEVADVLEGAVPTPAVVVGEAVEVGAVGVSSASV